MALYRHFRSKEELLGGLTERVWAEIDTDVDEAEGRQDPDSPAPAAGTAAMNAASSRSLSIELVFSAGAASSGEEDRLTLGRHPAARQQWSNLLSRGGHHAPDVREAVPGS
jgi:AcrR family transcriptional regulator